MSSERWSRALMEVGSGLGQIANYHAGKERDQMNHLREQSLIRLRGQQQKELEEVRGQRMSGAADLRYQRDLALENIRSYNRQQEREADRSYQDRRLDQQMWKQQEATNRANLAAIDKQIYDLDQMLSKASLDLGGVNEEGRAMIEQQRLVLEDQKRLEAFKGVTMLRELGDPRYKDKDDAQLLLDAGYSAEDVEAFIQDAQGGGASEAKPKSEPKESYESLQARYESGDYKGAPKEKQLDEGQAQAKTTVDEQGETQIGGERELMTVGAKREQAGASKYGANPDYDPNPLKHFGKLKSEGAAASERFLREQKIQMARRKQANGTPLTPDEKALLATVKGG